jgi:hypothetical protein
MKKLLMLLIVFTLCSQSQTIKGQELKFAVPGGKQGVVSVTTGKIDNNEFSMVIKVDWLNKKLQSIDDESSHIVFVKDMVSISGHGNIRCKTFDEKVGNNFYFNSSLTLNFVIEEAADLGKNEFTIDFPFQYASNVEDAMDPAKWVSFIAQSPRNYLARFNINPSDVKDLTAPLITVLTPEGVMDGFRPQVHDEEMEVKVLVKDRSSIADVSINGTRAIALNDTVFLAKVQFARMGGTQPIKVLASDDSGNQGENEFFVETVVADNIASKLYAQQNELEMVSDVDTLIPTIGKTYEHRYALIIGNEDYQSHQRGLNYESNVEFARRDAEVFKQYAIKTLGIKESNIIFLLDAQSIEMHRAVNQMNSILKATNGQGEAVVFFAGHGFPDEKTKEAYLIPVDVSGNDLEFGIKLKDFYAKLSEHPSKGVTVFLDACFSGGGRAQGLLAARAVRFKPKEDVVKGNIAVLSASSGNESALPYREQFHGMFSYYLMKGLQESQGDITLGELVEFVKSKVSTRSIITNSKEQTPTLNIGYQLGDDWKEWRYNQ